MFDRAKPVFSFSGIDGDVITTRPIVPMRQPGGFNSVMVPKKSHAGHNRAGGDFAKKMGWGLRRPSGRLSTPINGRVGGVLAPPRPSRNRTSGFPTYGSSALLPSNSSSIVTRYMHEITFHSCPTTVCGECLLSAIGSPWRPSLHRHYPTFPLYRPPSQHRRSSAKLPLKVALAYSGPVRLGT